MTDLGQTMLRPLRRWKLQLVKSLSRRTAIWLMEMQMSAQECRLAIEDCFKEKREKTKYA